MSGLLHGDRRATPPGVPAFGDCYPTARATLRGRTDEAALIERLLGGLSAGRSDALILRGGTGIGKTALLNYAVGRARGVTVLRAVGVESESEFPYAGLHQLLRPTFDVVPSLPSVQARALGAALGLDEEPVEDRFLVSVAVLGLLSEVAETRGGVLVVIDDLQWLDRNSIEALLFVGRRLEAEGVVMLMACGSGGRASEVAGLPELVLQALGEDDAAALLAETGGRALSPAVADQLLEIAAGNPLALCELPSSLTEDQLAGRATLPQPLPVREQVERVLRRRIECLSEHAGALLVLIAADDSGAWAVVRLAALFLDIEPDALEELEQAGLVLVDGRTITFRQPLVRSVAYQGAPLAQRQSAHLGLAEVLEYKDCPDRRVWHLASAAPGPDEAIADELEHAALRAQLRSAHAAAATAYERAADLSVDDSQRARRLLAAAEAHLRDGRGNRMAQLLQRAEPLANSTELRIAAAKLRGAHELERGDLATAHEVMFSGAKLIIHEDPSQALDLLMRGSDVAWWAGRLDWAEQLGTLAAAVPPSDNDSEAFMVDVLIGVTDLLRGELPRGVAALTRAREIAEGFSDPRYLLPAAHAAVHLGDDAAACRFLERAVGTLRAAGAVGDVPGALQFLAGIELWRGRLNVSLSHAFEALRLASDTGQDCVRAYANAVIATIEASRGNVSECRARAAEALAIADQRGLVLHGTFAHWALGRLELVLGRVDHALARFAVIADERPGVSHPVIALFATPEVVEAAMRGGSPELAARALTRLDCWMDRTGSPWSQAWSAALHAWVTSTLAQFDQALEIYARHELPYDEARVRLLYAERLRQRGLLEDARDQARRSLMLCERVGMDSWSQRARSELEAAGGHAVAISSSLVDVLSSQEQQIARLVCDGATNREIGLALFLSSKTVKYHLHNVYLKLGIRSRAELARVVGDAAAPSSLSVQRERSGG